MYMYPIATFIHAATCRLIELSPDLSHSVGYISWITVNELSGLLGPNYRHVCLGTATGSLQDRGSTGRR